MTETVHEITPELLKAVVPAMPKLKREQYAPLLTAAMLEFDITNEARAAAFIAQCAHEADNFKTLEEYASGSAYEGRRDLGNTERGDGKRFKGRGAIQLTGRDGYRKVGRALGLSLEEQPELAAAPENAFRIAGWFWTKGKPQDMNLLADRREFKRITKLINGGYNGLADRIQKYERALAALPDDFKLTEDAPEPEEVDADYAATTEARDEESAAPATGQAGPDTLQPVTSAEAQPGPTTVATVVEHADVVKSEATPAVQPKNEGTFTVAQSSPSWQSKLVVYGTGLLGILKFLQISTEEAVAWARGYAVDHKEQAFYVALVAGLVALAVWAHDRSMKRANERTLAAMDSHADPAKNNTTARP
jgi:predicted chitinase